MLQSIILIDPTATLSVKPDVNTKVVEPLDDDKFIKVEQIRQLVSWLNLTGFVEGVKRGIILQAQRWHSDAPHILLKALEEPTGQTIIILTVDNPSHLLPTILSRCAVFNLSELTKAQLADWGLEQGSGVFFEPPLSWQDFVAQPPLERWILAETWIKSKQNIGPLLKAWQKQLIDQPAINYQQRNYYSAAIEQSLALWQSNSSQRFVMDHLLIKLDRQSL